MRSECGEQRIGVKTHTAARQEVILTAREIMAARVWRSTLPAELIP